MFVSDILRLKGSEVISVSPDTTMVEVLRLFHEKQIGLAIVSTTPAHVSGTVSERDFCNAVAQRGAGVANLPVSEIMRSDISACSKDDLLPKVSATMIQKRTRHVLVLDGDTLVGVVSIGDVVKARLDEALRTQKELHAYIAGTGYH
ncbi:CBS domain-containing protein [Ruegeria sp. Ofav3-42]|uniref:CBS domain-containing protein n=1 Tax=Ruegeria sp. Ofav3-42 TaxID=2917759 RepID=UPI001EF66C9C|nr:CBS domain-containing protein [Ruegeria sp. Ofav3-42]MCG7522336.1 CBS domain-containing protein [Ruegeria sp. Ofav3-42]